MSDSHTIFAEMRDVQGTGASRRLRHAGHIPAILYGAGKDTAMLTLNHNSLIHNMDDESFHSSILTVDIEGTGYFARCADASVQTANHAYRPAAGKCN